MEENLELINEILGNRFIPNSDIIQSKKVYVLMNRCKNCFVGRCIEGNKL